MIGKTLAHYEITALLGKGGMGEVYRARDAKLAREVAIKVLSQEVSDDPERIARFKREARTLARLQHANIASIYGFEEHAGMRFLVMELVEGEDLQQRIRSGRLSPEKAIDIALQITTALEAAHDQSIVHRDLKPANVRITPDGEVKVLDFGLARAYGSGVIADRDPSNSPTITAPFTGLGVILGTAAYMSPEQARGEAVDARTDLWALGCLVYELLTGRRAFPGVSVDESIAATLHGEPDWTALPVETPRTIHLLLRSCLKKDPRQRLRSSADVRVILGEALREGPAAPTTRSNERANSRVALLILILVPLAALLGWWWRPPADFETPSLTRFAIELPEGLRLSSYFRHAVSISSDGGTIVFAAAKLASSTSYPDTTHLFARRLDRWMSTPIPGTGDALQPEISPDGTSLCFFQDGALVRSNLDGSQRSVLGAAGGVYGADWDPDGWIIASVGDALLRFPELGGPPDTLALADPDRDEVSLHTPRAIPGGRFVLTTVIKYTNVNFDWRDVTVQVLDMNSGRRRVLLEDAADARYHASGHLLFMRRGRLLAAPFDASRAEFTGPEFLVLEDVIQSIHTGHAGRETGAGQWAIADDGTLVHGYGPVFPERPRTAVWIDRDGSREPVGIPDQGILRLALSPDEKEILFTRHYPPRDVWTWDFARQLARRQTVEGEHMWAAWGPGANEFTVDRLFQGPRHLIHKPLDRTTEPGKALLGLDNKMASRVLPAEWSPDGTTLLCVAASAYTSWDIWAYHSDGRLEPLLDSQFMEMFPTLSPNGLWLAYASNESGVFQVYISPYPGPGRTVQVTSGGGWAPAWSRSGAELVFGRNLEDGNWAMYAASLGFEDSRVRPGRIRHLFDLKPSTGLSAPIRNYDIGSDGRLLMVEGHKDSDEEILDQFHPRSLRVLRYWSPDQRIGSVH